MKIKIFANRHDQTNTVSKQWILTFIHWRLKSDAASLVRILISLDLISSEKWWLPYSPRQNSFVILFSTVQILIFTFEFHNTCLLLHPDWCHSLWALSDLSFSDSLKSLISAIFSLCVSRHVCPREWQWVSTSCRTLTSDLSEEEDKYRDRVNREHNREKNILSYKVDVNHEPSFHQQPVLTVMPLCTVCVYWHGMIEIYSGYFLICPFGD